MTGAEPLPPADPAADAAVDADAVDADAVPADAVPADGGAPEDWAAVAEEYAADAFALLRRLRGRGRRGRAARALYAGYAAALGAVLVVPAAVAHVTALAPEAAARLAAAWPLAAVAVALAAFALMLRDTAWRGPVGVGAAAVSWLLPQPVSRARLLRPRYRAALAAYGAGGAALGAVAGVALAVAGVTGAARLVGAGAAAGALVGVTGCGAAALVQACGGRGGAVARRVAGYALVPVAALVALAAVAGAGHGGAGRTGVAWSGPWGWAVQPLCAAAGMPVAGWPVAVALAGVVAAVLAVAGDRAAPRVSATAVRARAAGVRQVAAALLTGEPRQAVLSIGAAAGRHPVARGIRLPRPRGLLGTVAWRDALALCRAPARLVWAALGVVAASAAAAGARTAAGNHGGVPTVAWVLLVVSSLALYGAAAQLAEPARLDADDPRRAANLPWRHGRLAMAHGLVPVALLLPATALAWGLWSLAGPAAAGTALLLASATVPLAVGLAVAMAYRGQAPFGLLAGVNTPVGNPGPLIFAAWYLLGPVLAAAVSTVLWYPAVIHHAAGAQSAANAVPLLLAGVAAFGWAQRRAARLTAP